jgi:hypothetical protein
MRVALLVFLCGTLAFAEDKWIEYRSGPFFVFSNAGDKVARERLTYLEQFRHALGTLLGKPDLTTRWPVHLVIARSAKPLPFVEGRAAILAAEPAGAAASPAQSAALARLLMDQNIQRLPEGIETGLVHLFSTLQVAGTRITVGEPPALEHRTRDWARLHRLATTPEFTARMRIFVSNLAQGAELNTAAKNAFEKQWKELEAGVDAYVAAGQFGTAPLSGFPVNPNKDYVELPVTSDAIRLLLADVALADPGRLSEARKAYEELRGPEADEGLGLVALREGKSGEALEHFRQSTAGGSKSARAWMELASLEQDLAKARAAFEKATQLNPRWAEPWRRWAAIETDAGRKAAALKAAASRDVRNSALWQETAIAQEKANQFGEAGKSWAAALKAADSVAAREKVTELRRAMEEQKAEFLIAEKRRQREEEERELQKLKDAAMAEVRAAEQAANQRLSGNRPRDPDVKVEQWWEDSKGDRSVTGVIERVDCTGGVMRVVIRDGSRQVHSLLLRNPKQVTIKGAGELTIACGPQKRNATLYFTAARDARFGTAGEIVTIELK